MDAPNTHAEDEDFVVDGVTFAIDYVSPSTLERFCICKPRDLVDSYRRLIAELEPRTIVELGIARGGSTAFVALLTDLHRLVSIELSPTPVAALATLIDQRGWGDRVRPYYGESQADRQRLAEIVDRERASEPIDLVVDDASHLLDETRTSFEVLFPRLRPGGCYVVEDWAAHHVYAKMAATIGAADIARGGPPTSHPRLEQLGRTLLIDEPGRNTPLSRMIVELVLARATSGDAVAELTIDGHWFTVRRGPAKLDPSTFTLDSLYSDHFGQV